MGGTEGVDPGRRRTLALGAWAAAVATAGTVIATRGRNGSDLAVVDPGSRTTTSGAPPVAEPPEVATGPAPATAPTTAPPAGAPVPATVAPAPAPDGGPGPTASGPPPADGTTTTTAPAPAPPPQAHVPLTGDALVRHVARRTTFGPTPALLEEIRTVGVDAWLDQQLRPWEIPDGAVQHELRRLPELNASAESHIANRRWGPLAIRDLRLAAVYRAVHSRRHLNEVMVDLWHDHLAASGLKTLTSLYLNRYDRDVIRAAALGRFVDLLIMATRSAAMLQYLDTAGSGPPIVNENHGRELLELHTVGRESGYTQDDVVGAARVLSGWTLTDRDDVVFQPSRHDPSPATVLGWSTPGRSGPEAAGDLDAMLNHLAFHPSTARRIARLLLTRFVADDPPAHLVESTAAAYLAAGTDIPSTLRHVFDSVEFRAGLPLTRRPFDLLAAQLRATAAWIDLGGGSLDRLLDGPSAASESLHWLLSLQRQPLFWALNPSGHPLAGHEWLGGDALLHRWRAADVLVRGLGGVYVDIEWLIPGQRTAAAAIDDLGPRLIGEPFSPATRAGALQAIGRSEDGILDKPTKQALVAFLLSAPELQTR